MDWNDLRYFLAISRAGTLVGAGRELGVEHTTVGRRLAALERALAARLFARGPDGLVLTSAGREILPSVEVIAAQVDTIERRISGDDARVEGTVRLTIPEGVNSYAIQAMVALRERHPALLVEVLSDNRAFDLRRGEADLALRFRDVEDPELIVRKLGEAGWSLYASNAYVERRGPLVSAEQLSGHELIGFAPSLAEVVGERWLKLHASVSQVVLRANSISAAAEAALVGIGLVPLPCLMGDQAPGLRRLTPQCIGSRDIALVVHPDLARAARVRATIDFLVETFARDAALWSGEQGAARAEPRS